PTSSSQTATTTAGQDISVEVLNDIITRNGPGAQFQAGRSLAPGDIVPVIGRNTLGTWLLVEVVDGLDAWIPADVVQPLAPAQLRAVPIATGLVNSPTRSAASPTPAASRTPIRTATPATARPSATTAPIPTSAPSTPVPAPSPSPSPTVVTYGGG